MISATVVRTSGAGSAWRFSAASASAKPGCVWRMIFIRRRCVIAAGGKRQAASARLQPGKNVRKERGALLQILHADEFVPRVRLRDRAATKGNGRHALLCKDGGVAEPGCPD